MKKALIIANMLFASATVFGIQNEKSSSLNQIKTLLSNIQYLESDNTAPQIKWTPKKWNEVIKTKKKAGKLNYFNTPLNSRGWTPLMYATKYSTLEVMEQLLKLKDSNGCRLINIDAQNKDLTNALMLAIDIEDINKIKLLLKYGADIFLVKNTFDTNSVKFAKFFGISQQILDTMVAQATNNIQLVTRAGVGLKDDVEKLLKSGAYINYQLNPDEFPETKKLIDECYRGRTALMSATIGKGPAQLDTFDLLLSHPDIDVNIIDGNGFTVLIHSVASGNTEMVEKLLAFRDAKGRMRVDVNYKTPDGWNSLDWCVHKGRSDILRQLIRAGADCSARGTMGEILLMDDEVLSQPDILNVFLSEINNTKSFRKYILGLLGSGDPTVRLRSYRDVQRNIDLIGLINDQQNELKITPLIRTAQKNYKESAQLLLNQNNIQIYLKDKFGHSALWYATTHGYEDLTKMLLERYDSQKLAAEIDEEDKGGDTLWNNICKEYNWDIADLILNYLPEDIREQKMSILERSRQQVINAIELIIRSIIQESNQIAEPADQVGTETLQIEQKPESIAISAKENNRLINEGFKENVAKAIEHFNTILSEEEGSPLETEARKSYDKCINDIKVLLKAKDNNEHRIVNIDLISEAALNASANGCLEILEQLIMYESSVIDMKDNEGNSLLMLAAKNGHLDIIPRLMGWYKNANKNSADNSYEKFLNKTNKHNYTALMLAAENGHEAVVKTFVEKYKVKSRDAKQASDVAQSQIKNLSKKNRSGNKKSTISICKSIKNILDIREEEAKKNEALNVEKVETYWPIFFSSESMKQFSSLKNNQSLKYIYDEVVLQLSELEINACPSTKKIEKLSSGLMAIRLNDNHRLVYDIDGDEIHIISCKDHYPNKENKRSRKDVLKGVKFNTQWTNGNFVSRNETEA